MKKLVDRLGEWGDGCSISLPNFPAVTIDQALQDIDLDAFEAEIKKFPTYADRLVLVDADEILPEPVIQQPEPEPIILTAAPAEPEPTEEAVVDAVLPVVAGPEQPIKPRRK